MSYSKAHFLIEKEQSEQLCGNLTSQIGLKSPAKFLTLTEDGQSTKEKIFRKQGSEQMDFIGDPRCKYNALSPEIRCAINPSGPCDGCMDFSKATVGDRISRRLQHFRSGNRKALLRIGLEISLGLAGAVAVGVPLGVFIGIGWMEYSEQGQNVQHSQQK